MSRPRKKIKPLVRQMPRTTGIELTGSCGHEVKERIGVSVRGDYTPENIAKLEKDKTLRKSESLKMLCRDCEANIRLLEITTGLKKLTDLLEIEDFPELEGTIRMQAYASEVRRQMLSAEVLNIRSNIVQRLMARSVIDQILLATLKKAWISETPLSSSEDLLDLHEEMNILVKEEYDGLINVSNTTQEVSLATWLLLRYQLGQYHLLFQEIRSKVWITLTRARYGSPMLKINELPSQVYLSAIVVSQFNCWDNRVEAWNAFEIFNQSADKDISYFLQKRAEDEPSLKSLMSQMGVLSALRGSPTPSIW